ncbi:hypothetical protein ACCO45_009610 [Purpureocillium lilacinum]|uniref:Uncharacterized protein n=1 Tax=Purpureocillium lilacinum TaxID=33203 RepID=A0ACC4DKA9_PURLI
MSRRHEYFYNDPYDHHDPHDALDYERRRPSSRSRHRGDRFSRALEQGYVHEARDIAKSVLLERRPERGTHREHYGRRGPGSAAAKIKVGGRARGARRLSPSRAFTPP